MPEFGPTMAASNGPLGPHSAHGVSGNSIGHPAQFNASQYYQHPAAAGQHPHHLSMQFTELQPMQVTYTQNQMRIPPHPSGIPAQYSGQPAQISPIQQTTSLDEGKCVHL